MTRDDRYAFRPVALCSLLALSGVMLLLLGLWLITMLRDEMMALALIVLFASGLVFLGVYLLGRCAVIMDAQGVRTRGSVGDWQEVRWTDVVSVSSEPAAHGRKTGDRTMLVIRSGSGVAVWVIRNEHTLAMLRRYSPATVPE